MSTAVVLDTNVLVSIFVHAGRLSVARPAIRDKTVKLVVSSYVLAEYALVLTRPKLLGPVEAVPVVRLIERLADSVGDVAVCTQYCRDSKDEAFVALAVLAGVPLVSGDGDVLALRGAVEGLEVWSPAEFLGRLQAGPTGQ